MQHKLPFYPSSQLLTRIDAYLLATVEIEREITFEQLEKLVLDRYGATISAQERLAIYRDSHDHLDFQQ